ncbi:hypothetical protein ABIB87_008382 [Bradyrhizobium sp. JR18.2]
MQPLMENPALAARGVPNSDLLAGSINSESTLSLRKIQASRLMRRCAISVELADALAPFVYGGAR